MRCVDRFGVEKNGCTVSNGRQKSPRTVILLLYKDVKTDPARGLPVFTMSLSENIALCVLSP
ncbi:MAG: hypothetical protein RMY29_006675 [Nostoc sp. CreGUA01]|nr:hypothetical protein [Nostoc sp. CreGUA01]